MIANPVEKAPIGIKWDQSLELSYDTSTGISKESICFNCSSGAASKLLKCSRCKVAAYCSKECQIHDWKKGPGGGHKQLCTFYSRLSTEDLNSVKMDAKEEARKFVFSKIRIYACAYAVYRASLLGKGFLFIQSDSTLAALSIPIPKDGFGRSTLGRSILMHYLTLGEYDMEICRDDFEMASVRSTLQKAVDKYDDQNEVIMLMRFRCGHVALGTAKIVPGYGACLRLGKDYFSETPAGAVQLQLDDV